MKEVTDRLLPDKSKTDEFEVFIGSRGGTSQIDQRKVVHEGGRLVVEYDRHHQIESINVADDYDESILSSLENQIAEALSEHGTDVGRRYLHSLYLTEGLFRYGDSFQILPSPPDAPQPEFLHAPHSFLLEYRFPKSPHGLVNQHRSTRRFSELSLLLNALLRSLTLPIGTASHEWVVTASPEWNSCYLQLGYFGGKEYRPKASDGFSSVKDLGPLDTVDAQSYYRQLGVISGSPLQLPDTFEESLTAYDELDDESKAKLCRASYWSQVSYRVFSTSQSASFAALVSAIEVFLPDPEARCRECGRPTSTKRCCECNQPISGPTRQFREFVERYVPGIPASHRNKLYNRRSSLSHGSSLLPGDLSEIGFRFTPVQNESWQERQLLSEIVQLILVNWLRSYQGA